MKQIFTILAVAATLAGFAACTKVDVDQTAARGHKISFEVASYLTQTKATNVPGSGTSLWGELTSPSFITNAYFYPETGDANQHYMNNVTISPYKSDGTTAATSEATTAIWQPAVEYFWPKTGYINFFSYAATKALTVSFADVASSETKTITIASAADPVTIAADDNFLLADACYNAKESNAGEDKNNMTGPSEVTPMGVPTLFRHLLCQVQFKARLYSEKKHANTKYEVAILSASINDGDATPVDSRLVNNGYLTATSGAKEGSTLEIQNWGTSGVQKWSEATTPAYEGVVAMTATTDNLVLPVQATAAAHNSATTHQLLDLRTFRPQAIAAASTFTITYTVTAYHGTVKYSEETITVSKALKDFTPNSGVWRCNDKVTYLISIDPVTSTITFDPAVAEWTEPNGALTIPLS